ncbi:transposase [Streptomyces sp. NPDC002911]
MGQTPPPGAGRTRRTRRAGLVEVRDRFGAHAGSERGDLTGPNPVDRGKSGSKIHSITERSGLPLSVGISGANLHDSQALEPMVRGIPPIRSRRGPRRRRPAKLHADKAYDNRHLRRWLRTREIAHRIARKGIESSKRLGRHRWTIDAPWPGSQAAVDSTAATSAEPNTSWPSPASPALSSATADSPNETFSKYVPGFVVLPRRWVVERSHAWVMHARRHARDYERLVQHSESLVTWAAITLMTRRITRRNSRRSGQPSSREAQRD